VAELIRQAYVVKPEKIAKERLIWEII